MIAVLDYDAGNLASVSYALDRLGLAYRITTSAAEAARSERLVFPGVGSAASGMAKMRERGFDRLLRDAARAGTPILGICLGMQLLHEHSEEDGGVEGMGLLPGRVRRFRMADPSVKVPHMGWNAVERRRAHPLLTGASDAFYFVHSYYVDAPEETAVGVTEYAGFSFTSFSARANVAGMQAHPERSAASGLSLWRRFAAWTP